MSTEYSTLDEKQKKQQVNNVQDNNIFITVEEFKKKNLESLTNKGSICIIGNGEIGDKAAELICHESVIKEVGLKIPQTIVLSENTLNKIISILGIGSGIKMSERYKNMYLNEHTKVPPGIIQFINQINQTFDEEHIIIRSSGKGDAVGTGIYHTSVPNIEYHEYHGKESNLRTLYRIIQVIESYYSKDAKEYRKQSQTGEGFGIILQKYIYQKSLHSHDRPDFGYEYAPVISGHGYTSTLYIPNTSVLTITPGGGGAVDGGGINNISKYSLGEEHDEIELFDVLLDENRLTLKQNNYDENLSRLQDILYRYQSKFHDAKGLSLFQTLDALDSKVGRRYIEFASIEDDDNLQHYITQISPVSENNIDILDIDDFTDIHLTGQQVTGTGKYKSKDIIYCMTADDITFLNDFNKNNKDYILITGAHLITSISPDLLRFATYSNAGAVLVINGEGLGGSLASHFRGLLQQTGKILASIDRSQGFHRKEYDTHIKGDFEVIASEKQNKLILLDHKKTLS